MSLPILPRDRRQQWADLPQTSTQEQIMSIQQVREYHDFVMRRVREWRFWSLPLWTGSQCDVETRKTYLA